jgi:hypothetical protein
MAVTATAEAHIEERRLSAPFLILTLGSCFLFLTEFFFLLHG